MVGTQPISFGGAFHLPTTLRLSLLSFNECSLFLELRLAFVFRLDFCSDHVLSLNQGVFGHLVYGGIHQKSCFKKVLMVLEKRKSFMQKVVQKGASLDRGLDICMPLKKSCVVLILWKHLFVFSFDALFGLTWRMLTTCLTLNKSS
jgi:hypothetical protein